MDTAGIADMLSETHHAHWAKLRCDLHAHPELRFEEYRTADVVARELETLGYTVSRGLGGTGVVASLTGANPDRGIVLRADLDALPIREANDFAHASCTDGIMHACGHDGHTVMLLGAAQVLKALPQLPGTVHFVFQPGEEGGAGIACRTFRLAHRSDHGRGFTIQDHGQGPGSARGAAAFGPRSDTARVFDRAAVPNHCSAAQGPRRPRRHLRLHVSSGRYGQRHSG